MSELNAQDATLFKPDTTSLDQDGLGLLDRVAAELRAHPGIRVEVAGHTDTNGTPDSNLRISQQRAEAVRDRLVAEGIEPARLVATGYGQARPRAANDTVEGRALNRRIEFNVLS
ncbi:MAG: OmpA family protein [Acidimicrobiia bacterium]|nr:OmpA family protein [Acidimicrobiia bacterium]